MEAAGLDCDRAVLEIAPAPFFATIASPSGKSGPSLNHQLVQECLDMFDNRPDDGGIGGMWR